MSDHILLSEQFENLLIAGVPFLDVRAEVEFAKGRFPTSTNIPILRDDERQLVGTCYKEEGREAAVKLGHFLVMGATKDRRIQAWCDFAKANPNTHIYCWRGGMRSEPTDLVCRSTTIVPELRSALVHSFANKGLPRARCEIRRDNFSGTTSTVRTSCTTLVISS